MSRDGSCEFEWADGTHRFRLAIGQARELEEKTGQGCHRLLERMASGDWRVADIRETIRLGLIGGGMEPLAALSLVRAYVDERPLSLTNLPAAKAILMAGLTATPGGEKPGKRGAAKAKSGQPNSPTVEPPLPHTTEQAQS